MKNHFLPEAFTALYRHSNLSAMSHGKALRSFNLCRFAAYFNSFLNFAADNVISYKAGICEKKGEMKTVRNFPVTRSRRCNYCSEGRTQ